MSVIHKLTNLIKSCRYRWFSQLAYSYLYPRAYKYYARCNGLKLQDVSADEFKLKWQELSKIWETTTLKYFANYMDNLSDIVPESVGRTCIEYVLNPISDRVYYSDKNMFARICGKENVVQTIICRVRGGKFLDGELRPIQSSVEALLERYDKVLLKPSIDSKGGSGIMLFTREDGKLKSGDVILTESMLYAYGDDFSIQEVVQQHDDLASLNPDSVNTLRVAVYRSVKDEKAHVIASFIRIGSSGCFVDNACAGGKYAGVDMNTGKVANTLRDINGGIYSSHNGIDFNKLDFTVPGWDIIKNECIRIAERITHHRLIAFDMTITNEMQPVLIEFNVESYNYGPFMYINQAPLGRYTDEIIEYCKTKLKK